MNLRLLLIVIPFCVNSILNGQDHYSDCRNIGSDSSIYAIVRLGPKNKYCIISHAPPPFFRILPSDSTLTKGLRMARENTPTNKTTFVFFPDIYELKDIVLDTSNTPSMLVGLPPQQLLGGSITCSNPELSCIIGFSITGSLDPGMAIHDGNILVLFNHIYNNQNIGLYCSSDDHTPYILGNIIEDNVNTAALSNGGGAIYNDDKKSVSLFNEFKNNQALGSGGGIYFEDSKSNFLFNSITYNYAQGTGGGVALNECEIARIALNEISKNQSDSCGGGVWCSGESNKPTLLSWNNIEDNIAAEKGGGIGVGDKGACIIIFNKIKNNNAEEGGGISCEGNLPWVKVLGNTISEDTADYGGGLWLSNFNSAILWNDIEANAGSNSGGGLYLEESSPAIRFNRIKDNISPVGGGFFMTGDSSLPVIKQNDVARNLAGDGGAIYCNDSSRADMQLNEFYLNIAQSEGGGIFITGLGTNPDIGPDNDFIKNDAIRGGGIYIDYFSAPSIDENVFFKNSAIKGGAIYCMGPASSISGNKFYWNQATQKGGAVYLTSNTVLQGNYFMWNKVSAVLDRNSLDGGGIYCYGIDSTSTIQDNYCKWNVATNGAAFSLHNCSSLSLTSNTFRENIAGYDSRSTGIGGGIHIAGGSVNINNDSLIWNAATHGGGIAVEDGSIITLTNSYLTLNLADKDSLGIGIGGALYAKDTGTSVIVGGQGQQNTFFENVSAYGGAIGIVNTAQLTIKSDSLLSNHAGFHLGYGNGGGIYLNGPGTVGYIGGNAVMGEGNVFERNTAGLPGIRADANGGGIAATNGVTLEIKGNKFKHNNACTGDGGSIYLKGNGTDGIIGGINDDDIINFPLGIYQYGNTIVNNNRPLTTTLPPPSIIWPSDDYIDPDTLTFNLDTLYTPPIPTQDTVPIYKEVPVDGIVPLTSLDITKIDSNYYVFYTLHTAGLNIVKVTDPTNPVHMFSVSSESWSADTDVFDFFYLAMADWEGGLKIYDISQLNNSVAPELLDVVSFDDNPVFCVTSDSNRIYALTQDNSIHIIGRELSCFYVINTFNQLGTEPEYNNKIVASDSYLFLHVQAQDSSYLVILENDNDVLSIQGEYVLPGFITDFTEHEGYVYLTHEYSISRSTQSDLLVLNVQDPSNITELTVPDFPKQDLYVSVFSQGDDCYLTGNDSLCRINLSTGNYSSCSILGPGIEMAIFSDTVYDEYAFLCEGNKGFSVYNIETWVQEATIDNPDFSDTLDVKWYSWIDFPPDTIICHLPYIYDTIEVDSPYTNLPARNIQVLEALKSNQRNSQGIRNSLDTLFTINGGAIAVEDTAKAVIIGNLVGGPDPLNANTALNDGGGIYVYNGGEVSIGQYIRDTTNRENYILGNIAQRGGGISLVDHTSSFLNISNNYIGGETDMESNVATNKGGGIFTWNSNVEIDHNIIFNNYTGIDSLKNKSEAGFGGGLALLSSNSYLHENWIIANFSYGNAGGIGIGKLIHDYGKSRIISNTITENKAIKSINEMADSCGGVGSDLFIGLISDSCIVSTNIFDHFSNFECYAIYGDSSLAADTSKIIISNNDVWNSLGKKYGGIISDRTGTDGNISFNPLFVNPEINNYNLDPFSPATGMGWNPEPANTVVSNNTLAVPGTYSTIGTAMNMASYGDLIKVDTSYVAAAETYPIKIKNGVILVSSAFDDPIDIDLIEHTVIEGDQITDILVMDSTGPRTVVAGFTIKNGKNGIKITDGRGLVLGNLLIDNDTGISMVFHEDTGRFADNLFVDHNTILDQSNIRYSLQSTRNTNFQSQEKLGFGPVLSYNILSLDVELDETQMDTPLYIIFENNDFWPGPGINGYYNDTGTISSSNFYHYPDFVDTTQDDYHLQQGSPCIYSNNYTGFTGALSGYLDADFSADTLYGPKPFTVTFTNESVFALQDDDFHFFWRFGTGDSSTLENPVYIYADTGTYTVSLTVWDGYSTDMEIKEDYVTVMTTMDIVVPSDTLLAGEDTCWFGLNSITIPETSGSYVVESGGALLLVAGGTIILKPEFHAKSGSICHFYISSLGCPTPPEPPAESVYYYELFPDDDNMFVYPNPTRDILVIQFMNESSIEDVHIQLYNMVGSLLFDHTISRRKHYQIDLSCYQPGLYLLKVLYGKKLKTKKIIKY